MKTFIKLALLGLVLYLVYRWWQSRQAAAAGEYVPEEEDYSGGGGGGSWGGITASPGITTTTTPSGTTITGSTGGGRRFTSGVTGLFNLLPRPQVAMPHAGPTSSTPLPRTPGPAPFLSPSPAPLPAAPPKPTSYPARDSMFATRPKPGPFNPWPWG